MSEQVQAIVEAVRALEPEERRELVDALASIGVVRSPVTEARRQLVESIRGKYRHVATSSESFLAKKIEDTASEEPRR